MRPPSSDPRIGHVRITIKAGPFPLDGVVHCARDRVYPVRESIMDKCEQKSYSRWLQAKAMAYVRRDRKRSRDCTVAGYQAAIHAAVVGGGDRELQHWRTRRLVSIRSISSLFPNQNRVAYMLTTINSQPSLPTRVRISTELLRLLPAAAARNSRL
jgi:hypothetical protein